MKAVIISGGTINFDFALDFLKKETFGLLIAADKGMEFCSRAGFLPDAIIGDFDSADAGVLADFEKKNVQITRLRPCKDASDTQEALLLAKSLRAKEAVILGATGTRLDHVWANIQLLAAACDLGMKVMLADANNRISVRTESFRLKKSESFGRYISFFSLGDCVEELTLKGFFYPLEDYCLRNTDAGLTVSNEITEETAFVSFKKGLLLVIESRD